MTRTAALVAVAAGLVGATVAAAPAGAALRAAGDPETPVVVGVQLLEPRAPRPGDAVQLAGTLRNTGAQVLRQVHVRLRVGAPATTRSALDQADTEGAPTSPVQATDTALPQADLAPGAVARFDLRTLVARLPLSGDGVYPLQMEVRASTDTVPQRTEVGLATTFLPWFTAPPTGTTRLAWVLPVGTQPSQAARSTTRGPVLLDDALARDLQPAGRLGRLLAAGGRAATAQCDSRPGRPTGTPPLPASSAPCRAEAVPVAYAVDPDLAATAAAMARGYDLRLSDRRTRPGTGAPVAARWLDALKATLQTPGAGLVGLPYADPDVVALAASALRDDVSLATTAGAAALQSVTGVAPLPGVQLAVPGALTPGALEAYAAAGTRTLLTGEDALPLGPTLTGRTPAARTALPVAGTRLAGLVADAGLSTQVQPPPERWQGARLAEQRWIAETAIIAAERPGETRTLLVVPARGADLQYAPLAAELLDTGRLPWLCGVPLADVASGTEACPGTALAEDGTRAGQSRGSPVVPAADAPAVPAALLSSLVPVRAAVDQLTEAVLAPTPAAAETRARMLRAAFRAESLAWRDPSLRPRGRQLVGLLHDDVADLSGFVRVLTSGLTLSGSSGSVPVDVENRLAQPVTVGVRLGAPGEARLDTSVTGVVTVPPGTSVPVALKARPRTSGQFPVTAQLLDRTGAPFGVPSRFVIRSTRYGTAALALTGIGALVLFLAAGVRIVRRGLTTRADRLAHRT